MIREFKNESPTDFTDEINYKMMLNALKKNKDEFGSEYPLIIDGKSHKSDETITSINPSQFDQVIGHVNAADETLAQKALEAALDAFEDWKNVSPGFRARCLFKAAGIMRRRKTELTALIVLENGKNWTEADGDVAEAIDFLDFYAINALKLSDRQSLQRIDGEDNELNYIPLGAGVVIAPWNFPLAILTGMTAGPLVMGNTIIMKPSSNTPVIAYRLMEILLEAGVPHGVVNLVFGHGSVVGKYLVIHPKTRFINFTGSREQGLKIIEEGSKAREGQKWIKRISAEMGGKNAIIVDSEADLDAAVDGIITSAFGFQGQKCSACSRAIIDKNVYEYVADKLLEKAESLNVGPAEDNSNEMGPLIDQDALDKVFNYIEIGKEEGTLLYGGKIIEKGGFYVEPTIFSNIDSHNRLAQEEIFGPVLALMKANNFEHALEIANSTEYGLTGSVYSNSREKLEKARNGFHVGNLYFNRTCTAALVGVHPFGGYNMSGTCAKAGSKDYLRLFCQAKAVSERIN
ncbi:MAG: L-glutamate gamma-semialdehyde dehydrogenase [Bacillota bacterium]